MHHITPKALYALLKPYENYKLGKQSRTGPWPYVDIAHGVTNSIGADIRDVTPEGVEIHFYNSCELIPYEAIKIVTIRSADNYNTLARMEYRVGADLAQAAA